MSYERLEKGYLQWPCPDEDHPGTPILHKDKFARAGGKAAFCPANGARRTNGRTGNIRL